jgi:hypothetical protein
LEFEIARQHTEKGKRDVLLVPQGFDGVHIGSAIGRI